MELAKYLIFSDLSENSEVTRLTNLLTFEPIELTQVHQLDTTNKIFLYLRNNLLSLVEIHKNKIKSKLNINFDDPKLTRRLSEKNKYDSELSKAVGLNKKRDLNIIDATAGLCRDAYILSELGANVLAFERNLILSELIKNALNHNPTIKNLKILNYDFLNIDLKNVKELGINTKIDVIYLDPMFPERKKSALVKKEAQWLKAIVSEDTDCDLLLKKAFELGATRIVVKRPKLAGFLNNQEPQHQIAGASIRYDVYL
jgi:16S rRNA (guanine1516-N2)-methyltransferase